jgi:hypothetical protein
MSVDEPPAVGPSEAAGRVRNQPLLDGAVLDLDSGIVRRWTGAITPMPYGVAAADRPHHPAEAPHVT